MKYNDNHTPEFVGASGICIVCGLTVELDGTDKPDKRVLGVYPAGGNQIVYEVKCPHCGKIIQCKK